MIPIIRFIIGLQMNWIMGFSISGVLCIFGGTFILSRSLLLKGLKKETLEKIIKDDKRIHKFYRIIADKMFGLKDDSDLLDLFNNTDINTVRIENQFIYEPIKGILWILLGSILQVIGIIASNKNSAMTISIIIVIALCTYPFLIIKDYSKKLVTKILQESIFKRFFKVVGIGSLVAGGGILAILFSILQFAFTAIAGLGMIVLAINLFLKGSIIIGLLALLVGTPLAIGLTGYLFPFLFILTILSAIIWGIAHIFGFSISFDSAWSYVWMILIALLLGNMATIGITEFIVAVKEKRPLYFFKERWLGILFFCFLIWFLYKSWH